MVGVGREGRKSSMGCGRNGSRGHSMSMGCGRRGRGRRKTSMGCGRSERGRKTRLKCARIGRGEGVRRA